MIMWRISMPKWPMPIIAQAMVVGCHGGCGFFGNFAILLRSRSFPTDPQFPTIDVRHSWCSREKLRSGFSGSFMIWNIKYWCKAALVMVLSAGTESLLSSAMEHLASAVLFVYGWLSVWCPGSLLRQLGFAYCFIWHVIFVFSDRKPGVVNRCNSVWATTRWDSNCWILS